MGVAERERGGEINFPYSLLLLRSKSHLLSKFEARDFPYRTGNPNTMRHFPYLKLLFFVCICARLPYGLRRTFFFERRRRSDLPQPIFDNKSTVMISLPPSLFVQ